MHQVSDARIDSAQASCMLSRSLSEPEIYSKPNRYYEALRVGDPVHYDEKLGMYLVSRYQDLTTVLQDSVTYSQRKGWDEQFAHGYMPEFKQIMEKDGGGFFPETLILDPPEHTRIRRLIEKAFTPRRVKLLQTGIERIVANAIDGFVGKGRVEAVEEFAVAISTQVMCHQLGFDYQEVGDKVISWSHAYVAQVSGLQSHAEMLRNAALICEMQQYIIGCIRERMRARREDMISDLIYAELEDSERPKLEFAELVATVRGLLNGGIDTTAMALSHLLLILATRPDLASQLNRDLGDDTAIGRFVDEVLRIEPPVRGLFRTTTKPVELGGKLLPSGARIVLLFASANDDEEMFASPRTFDAARKNVMRHLSFGGGIHFCAGMSLAKMEMRVAVRGLMKRLEDIRLEISLEEITYRPSIAALAIERLPLVFSAKKGSQSSG